MKIKVVTLCSGYDSQCMALEELKKRHEDFDYELIAWSEIDKFAIQAHDLCFPQYADRNLGDMTVIDWTRVEDFDLLTYSTPCQSISSAGLQHGLEEGSGTRSSILWSTRNAIITKKPKYLLMENVSALVQRKFFKEFRKWCRELESYGYTNYFAPVYPRPWDKDSPRTKKYCINAKDYGVPQNRERVILVSILGGSSDEFRYPPPRPLSRTLKDMLETNVSDTYYLNEEEIEKYIAESDEDMEQEEMEDITSGMDMELEEKQGKEWGLFENR